MTEQKKPPDNPVLSVVKTAKPVNAKGEQDQWADRRTGDFMIQDGRIWFMRKGRDSKKAGDDQAPQINEIPTALTDNFIALVAEQTILDDGAKTEAAFLIDGKQRHGGPLPALTIPATQYQAMQWPLKQWGARAIVEADQATPRRLANAILKLSGEIPITTVYQHTGWRRIDGEWHYLTGSGAIHAGGLNASIKVELGDGNIAKYLLPAPPEQPRQFAGGLLDLLSIAPNNPTVGVALFAGVARAVLGEVLPIDFSLFLAGRSGSQKSECAAAALACFGQFDARSFPANFTDTEADLEHKAHQAKDAVFSVDDFAPSVNNQEANRLHTKAERLFRSVGNQAGRGRRNADMTGKAAYFPRGLLIATGEDLPRGASCLGRLLVAEMKRGDVDLSVLTRLQQYARAGHLAAAMAGFVQWLAPRIDDLKKTFPIKVRDLRDDHLKEFAGAHTRAPELYGNLYAAADLLLDFLQEVEAINSIRVVELAYNIDETLKAAMRLQSQYQRQSDEVERFVALLRACFSAGEVHVGDHLNQGPPKVKEFAFGWRKPNPEPELVGCGSPIGWLNENKGEIWLEPEPTFKAVQRFANSQNEPIILNRATLWKRLFERGLLLAHDTDNKTGAIREDTKRVVAGRRARVLVMSADLITGCDDDWQTEHDFKNRYKSEP